MFKVLYSISRRAAFIRVANFPPTLWATGKALDNAEDPAAATADALCFATALAPEAADLAGPAPDARPAAPANREAAPAAEAIPETEVAAPKTAAPPVDAAPIAVPPTLPMVCAAAAAPAPDAMLTPDIMPITLCGAMIAMMTENKAKAHTAQTFVIEA